MYASSHYLIQCWDIINSNLRNKRQWNIKQNYFRSRKYISKWRIANGSNFVCITQKHNILRRLTKNTHTLLSHMLCGPFSGLNDGLPSIRLTVVFHYWLDISVALSMISSYILQNGNYFVLMSKYYLVYIYQRWPWKSIILDAIITRNGHQRRNKGLAESLFLFPQTMYYTNIIFGWSCRFIKLITSDCIFYILCDWFSSWRIHFIKQQFVHIFISK